MATPAVCHDLAVLRPAQVWASRGDWANKVQQQHGARQQSRAEKLLHQVVCSVHLHAQLVAPLMHRCMVELYGLQHLSRVHAQAQDVGVGRQPATAVCGEGSTFIHHVPQAQVRSWSQLDEALL